MPDFFRATATAMAKTSCCWIQRRTRTAMHLPCSAVSSMVAMVRRVDDSGEIAEEESSTISNKIYHNNISLYAVLDFGWVVCSFGFWLGVGGWRR